MVLLLTLMIMVSMRMLKLLMMMFSLKKHRLKKKKIENSKDTYNNVCLLLFKLDFTVLFLFLESDFIMSFVTCLSKWPKLLIG